MRIFLAGVSCVGKTTIGAQLAGLLQYRFFDLDAETERFFETSIERLRSRHQTSYDFRRATSQALQHVLSREDSCNCVIALPPSGLLDGYWKVVKETPDSTIIVLRDTPENILKRITFYDIDSRPVQKNLTDHEKNLYCREIKRDITYFSRSFRRAHVSIDITGCRPDEASHRIKSALTAARIRTKAKRRNNALQGSMYWSSLDGGTMARAKDEIREQRIAMEAVVDAYDSGERAMGWYYYLDGKMKVPFKARCRLVRPISTLKVKEEVKVLGMAPEEACESEMFVWVERGDERIAVPLAQLRPLSKDQETQEAVGDWLYWVDYGYEL